MDKLGPWAHGALLGLIGATTYAVVSGAATASDLAFALFFAAILTPVVIIAATIGPRS